MSAATRCDARHVPNYLVESYVSNAPGALDDSRERAQRAAELGGVGFRYVRTTFLRDDETCFHVFEATSLEALVEAAQRAGLPDTRVTEAIESEDGRGRPE
jgi:Protein of unknown function (DUF4242)